MNPTPRVRGGDFPGWQAALSSLTYYSKTLATPITFVTPRVYFHLLEEDSNARSQNQVLLIRIIACRMYWGPKELVHTGSVYLVG